MLAWLARYGHRYEPFVIAEEASSGELIGLLTLAVERASGRVFTAGTHHAEYQSWLARPGASDAFMRAAATELRSCFPTGTLQFLFVPPGAPLGFTDQEVRHRRAEVHTNSRGVLAVGDGADIEASLRKKSNRSRLQRLARHGEVSFEQLETVEQLDAVLDDIVDFCDLRQGAIHDVLPFADDPDKREWYRDLMRAGLLHATVLKVGGALAAAHLGVRDGDRVILGLIVHSPFFAEHSPGKLQLLLLGQLLARQGIAALDLTPGGAYKERFQSEQEMVRVLTLFFSERDALRHLAHRVARHAVRLVRADTDRLRRVAREWHARFRTQRAADVPRKLLNRGRRLLWESWESRIYLFPVERASTIQRTGTLRKNDLRALLAFRPAADSVATRGAFLREALSRLEQGQHVYTYVENGVLAHYVWLVERQERASLAAVDQEMLVPADSAVAFDAYTHPTARGKGIYRAALTDLLCEAASIPGTKYVCSCLLSHIGASRHLVDSFGFEYQGSFFKTTRFGRRRRWCEMPPSWPRPQLPALTADATRPTAAALHS